MPDTRRLFSRLVLVTVAICAADARAEVLDPLAFTSLGTLNLAGGSFTKPSCAPGPPLRPGSSALGIAPAGGFNGDGSVDAANHVVWRKNDGTPQDFDTWCANFGATAGSGSASSANMTVPESASARRSFCTLGACCAVRTRGA